MQTQLTNAQNNVSDRPCEDPTSDVGCWNMLDIMLDMLDHHPTSQLSEMQILIFTETTSGTFRKRQTIMDGMYQKCLECFQCSIHLQPTHKPFRYRGWDIIVSDYVWDDGIPVVQTMRISDGHVGI